MSRSLNKVMLIGNVGSEPEVRTTGSGKRLAKFSLATSHGRGESEKTQWHRVQVWDKLAEVVEQYVGKGHRLYIEGRIEYGSYEKDGRTVYTTDIIAHDLVMLDGRNEAKPARAAVGDPFAADDPDDPLPF